MLVSTDLGDEGRRTGTKLRSDCVMWGVTGI